MTVPPPINPIITIQPLTAVGIPADSASNNVVLAGAKHGDVIEGFVVNRDANQNPILRTPLGDILVKSDIFLKTGSEVQIRVDVQLASRARIITIDGQAPEIYAKTIQPQAPRGDVILQSSIISQQRTAAAIPANTSTGLIADELLPTLSAVILRQDELPINTRSQQQTTQQLPSQRTALPQSISQRPAAGVQVQVTILAGTLPATTQHMETAIEQLLMPATAPTASSAVPLTPKAGMPDLPFQSTQQTLQQPPVQTLQQPAAPAPNQPLAAPQPLRTPAPVQGQPAAATLQASPTAQTAAHTVQPATVRPNSAAATYNIAPSQMPAPPAAATSLSEGDVHMLLAAATSQKPSAATLPAAISNPALAAQTLGQEDVPHTHTLQSLPSSYRPFAGANVIQQATVQPTVSGTANLPQPAQSVWIHPTANQPTATASNPAPVTASPATQPPLRGEVMQVIGHEPDGGTVLKGEHTTLKLFTAKPLPTGTQLAVEITQPNEPRPLNAMIPARLVEFSALSSHWPALDEAVTTLTQTAQPLQQPISPAMLIPTVGPRLAHDVMLFLSVVRGGDVGRLWPTQIIKQLEETKPDLLQRLQADVGTMQQLAQPANPQQWAVYLVPLLFGGEAQHMRLFVRSDDGNKPGEDAIHNQRFIMEIELSNLGDMQLDGFVRGGKRPSQFDLVIRTVKTLPASVEADIRRLFSHALDTTHLKGQIIFQTGREHFIAPASHIRPAENDSGDDFTLIA